MGKGLALVDIITDILEMFMSLEFPSHVKIYVLKNLSEIE